MTFQPILNGLSIPLEKLQMIASRTLLLYVLIGLFSSCQLNRHNEYRQFKCIVIDSFSSPMHGSDITPVAYNGHTNNYLFLDNLSGTKIYEINQIGTIIHQITPLGQDSSRIQGRIGNISYLNDTILVITSEFGYYFLSTSGQIIRKQYSPNNEPISGVNKTIRLIKIGADSIFASEYRSPIPYDTLLTNNWGSKRYIDSMKFITLHNINTNKFILKFGFENGGLHKKYVYDYREEVLFDYDSTNGNMTIIYSPDPALYVYNKRDNFDSYKKYPFLMSNFKMPIKYKIGDSSVKRNYSEMVLVNSSINSVHNNGKFEIVTYRTGIPETVFDQLETNEQYAEVSNKFMKSYCIILENGNQISGDIELPKGVNDISFFLSLDKIICYKVDLSEGLNPEPKFYICKLVEQ